MNATNKKELIKKSKYMKVKSSNQEEITKKLLETNKEWIEFYTEKLERYQTEREILLNHLKQTL